MICTVFTGKATYAAVIDRVGDDARALLAAVLVLSEVAHTLSIRRAIIVTQRYNWIENNGVLTIPA